MRANLRREQDCLRTKIASPLNRRISEKSSLVFTDEGIKCKRFLEELRDTI